MALCFGLVRHAGGVGVIGANDLSMFNVAGACHRHGQCYGRGLGFITSLNTEDGFTRAVMDYILRARAMEEPNETRATGQDFPTACRRGGTLVTHDKVLTEWARAAVHRMHEEGIRFAITSGRPPRGMVMLTDPLRIDTAIAASTAVSSSSRISP
jgi:hypothetical protein